MGNRNGRIEMPTASILRRMDECFQMNDKDSMYGYMKMLDQKFQDSPREEVKNSKEFREASGARIIIKILKSMLNDEQIVKKIMDILNCIKRDVHLATDIIQLGGIDYLSVAAQDYEQDDFLSDVIPHYIKAVLAIGSTIAIEEIKREATYLRLCQKCQEVVERERMLETGTFEFVSIKPIDRVNRILMFMTNYITREDVQCAALDSILTFCQNADAKSGILDSKLIPSIGKAIESFPKSFSVLWRVCRIISIIAQFDEAIALEILKSDIHEFVAKTYFDFKEDPRVQQFGLWMLDSFLVFPKSARKIKSSDFCMKLFRLLLEIRSDLIRTSSVSVKDRFKPYETVVPVRIRHMLLEIKFSARDKEDLVPVQRKRVESDSLQLGKTKPKKEKVQEEKFRYGSVDTRMYGQGSGGLLDTSNTRHEDVSTAKTRPPDWEKHLQYGDTGKKRKDWNNYAFKTNKVAPQ